MAKGSLVNGAIGAIGAALLLQHRTIEYIHAMEDPRYPIGKFAYDKESTPQKRETCMRDIAELPVHVRKAVSGLTAAQLDTPYRDGGWTVRQVVHHLADSHMNAFIRFKLALTEDAPRIKPYDEKAWVTLADVQGQDIGSAGRLFDEILGQPPGNGEDPHIFSYHGGDSCCSL